MSAAQCRRSSSQRRKLLGAVILIGFVATTGGVTGAPCEFVCDQISSSSTDDPRGAQPGVSPSKCQFEPSPIESKTPDQLRSINPSEWDGIVLDKVRSSRLPVAGEYRPKLLCLTYTVNASHAKAASLYNEWGKAYCDRHMLFTNAPPVAGVPAEDVVEVHPPHGPESYMNMWLKVLEIRKYVAQQWWARDFDFMFMSGDDALLHVPNLRRYLSEPQVRYAHESGAPLHIGYRHHPNEVAFLSGAGTLMNQAALRTWEVYARFERCFPESETFAEDVHTSMCFGTTGMDALDARDEFGHDRFNIFPPDYTIGQALNPQGTRWFLDYRDRPHPTGLDTVSRDAVMWHYVQPDRMKRFCERFWKQTADANKAFAG